MEIDESDENEEKKGKGWQWAKQAINMRFMWWIKKWIFSVIWCQYNFDAEMSISITHSTAQWQWKSFDIRIMGSKHLISSSKSIALPY